MSKPIMFTGIIEEVGTVREIAARGEAIRLSVEARVVSDGARPADSVAVNGTCLTVVETGEGLLGFDVIPETLRKTALGALQAGSPVNLERSMRVGDRLGGHFVQGHVDAMGTVCDVATEGEWYMLSIKCPESVGRYLIPQGSISVDGVSLTVARMLEGGFTVALIPHTLENTQLGRLRPGDPVNLEADMLGKYVDQLLAARGLGAGGQAPAP